MRLETGRIYLLKYFNYKHDKEPLILVLYHGPDRRNENKEIVHGINLNYLSNKLNNQMVDFIVQVATRQIRSKNAYTLYHNQIKNRIPKIIKVAYRTYLWKYAARPIQISRGFDETIAFIKNLNKANGLQKTQSLLKQEIKTEIQVAKENKADIKKKTRTMTSEEIVRFVDNYIRKIQDVKIPDELRNGHQNRFTKKI